MKIGAQLFTLRDYCKNLDDFKETLKKVADMGYTSVQVSATCPYEPNWLAEQLKANGLVCPITHYNPDKIKGNPAQTAKDHLTFGCKHVGLGSAPGGLGNQENYDKFLKEFKPAAQVLADNGTLFMYHNHYLEFEKDANGVTFMEKLAKDFTARELGFTLDTFWVQYSGGDPAQWIEKLSGRVPCIHLKDMAVLQGKQAMAVVGEGNINFERVLCAAEKAGTEYLLVEQDNCNGENPFDCLKRSYNNLKKMGLD